MHFTTLPLFASVALANTVMRQSAPHLSTRSLITRQTSTGCTSICSPVVTALDTCTSALTCCSTSEVSAVNACLSCLASNGAASADVETIAGDYIQGCAALGVTISSGGSTSTVLSLTAGTGSSATQSFASGFAPATSELATFTISAVLPSASTSTSGPSSTDSPSSTSSGSNGSTSSGSSGSTSSSSSGSSGSSSSGSSSSIPGLVGSGSAPVFAPSALGTVAIAIAAGALVFGTA
ncbi:hypothetical protein K488DRAFT_85121 [Vararia minispora EC-137]|uniref:Uncharacterized protein n=1 Tax=Vararia minispora EC-137 TaxID=1314806 RepID=A0ACB8QNE4_9AGAM|nr:hypothetical protein K488DRAFT_85121 [Vararia minispora EC-137]